MFDGDERYDTKVVEGPLSMRGVKDELNDRWKDGWGLHTALMDGTNMVLLFERRDQAS